MKTDLESLYQSTLDGRERRDISENMEFVKANLRRLQKEFQNLIGTTHIFNPNHRPILFPLDGAPGFCFPFYFVINSSPQDCHFPTILDVCGTGGLPLLILVQQMMLQYGPLLDPEYVNRLASIVLYL